MNDKKFHLLPDTTLLIYNFKTLYMNITWKRNYKYILLLWALFCIWILLSQTRIISYNFWKYNTQVSSQIENTQNNINILDDSLVHEISVDISNDQYEYLINSYKNNKEKEYISVNITIDGVTLSNVWLKLKGNIDLVNILSSSNGFIQPAFTIKFDKYVSWQFYNGLSEIALRVDNSESLLGQLMSFKILEKLWLYSPKAAYTSLSFWNYGNYLYMINEAIDEEYVTSHFENTSWVLYKALNSLSFAYLWEDPTLYTELFEQETMENNYDMKLLINILKFVSLSSPQEFEENIEKYIDIDSYIWMIAMDEVLWKEDFLLWLLNNYYIYINSSDNKAYFISWDQKMSFWNINTALYDILMKYYNKNEIENLEDITSLIKFTTTWVKSENITSKKWDKTYLNDLKTRLLENETYQQLYEEKIKEYSTLIYNEWLAGEVLTYYTSVFTEYSSYELFISKTELSTIINQIKNYILSKN